MCRLIPDCPCDTCPDCRRAPHELLTHRVHMAMRMRVEADVLITLAVRGCLSPGGEDRFKEFVVALAEWRDAHGLAPIPMILHCPLCHQEHVDEGEWATRPHRTHRCAVCGSEWRPANVPTVGVRALPPDHWVKD